MNIITIKSIGIENDNRNEKKNYKTGKFAFSYFKMNYQYCHNVIMT